MSEGFVFGARVRLSALGIKKRIIKRGATTGKVIGSHANAVAYLIILRDGLKHEEMFSAEFWELDE